MYVIRPYESSLKRSAAGEIREKASCGVMVAGSSGKSTKITLVITSPTDLSRSPIRGKPPTATSPRPSATGSLQVAFRPAACVAEVVGAGVGDGVGDGDDVGAGAAEALGAGVGDEEGDCDGEAVGLAIGVVSTPRFQTLFFPLFMQVKTLPLYSLVVPSFGHAPPAFGVFAEIAGAIGIKSGTSRKRMESAEVRRMPKG